MFDAGGVRSDISLVCEPPASGASYLLGPVWQRRHLDWQILVPDAGRDQRGVPEAGQGRFQHVPSAPQEGAEAGDQVERELQIPGTEVCEAEVGGVLLLGNGHYVRARDGVSEAGVGAVLRAHHRPGRLL